MNRKKVGWFLIISPPVCLVLALSIFPLLQASLSTMSDGSQSTMIVMRVLRSIIGIIGIYGALGLLFVLPFGIYFVIKSDQNGTTSPHHTPNNIDHSVHQPVEHHTSQDHLNWVNKLSFSAFFFTFIYLLGNKMWKWLLMYIGLGIITGIGIIISFALGFASILNGGSIGSFIGIAIFAFIIFAINFVFSMYLLIRGRRIAWNEGTHWESFEQFRKRQKIIFWIGWAIVILRILLGILIPDKAPTANLPEIIQESDTAEDSTSTALDETFQALGERIENSGFYSTNAVLDRYERDDKKPIVNSALGTPISGQDRAFSLLTGIATSNDSGLHDGDSDGISYVNEYLLGTDPRLKDSDSDGFSDLDELKGGYNPALPNSVLPTANTNEIFGTWYNTDNDYITLTLHPDGTAEIIAPKQKFSFPKFFWKLEKGSILFALKKESLTFDNPRVAIHLLARTTEGLSITTLNDRPIIVTFKHK